MGSAGFRSLLHIKHGLHHVFPLSNVTPRPAPFLYSIVCDSYGVRTGFQNRSNLFNDSAPEEHVHGFFPVG